MRELKERDPIPKAKELHMICDIREKKKLKDEKLNLVIRIPIPSFLNSLFIYLFKESKK